MNDMRQIHHCTSSFSHPKRDREPTTKKKAKGRTTVIGVLPAHISMTERSEMEVGSDLLDIETAVDPTSRTILDYLPRLSIAGVLPFGGRKEGEEAGGAMARRLGDDLGGGGWGGRGGLERLDSFGVEDCL